MSDTVSLTIQDVAFGGKGVGRAGGKVVFVPFVIEGEAVTAQVVKQKKTFAEAALVSVQQTSPHRVEPPCPYFGRCGGCAYQHTAYARQLEIKARQVEQTLRRVGRLESAPVRPMIPSPKQYGYRNRIRVHVQNGVVGFYRYDRHELLDIERCPISAPAVNDALGELRQRAVRDGDYTLAAARERDEFFTQTNDDVAAALLDLVRSLVRRDHALLIDAYCGAGFFAKGFAGLFPRVVGIESNASAVAHARQTAAPNETYFIGDVAEHLDAVLSAQESAKTTLLLDPPATGIEARVLDFILFSKPNEVVYVSCNPATLARDLAALCRVYTLESVTPLDMFPQTAEIEAVAHLRISST